MFLTLISHLIPYVTTGINAGMWGGGGGGTGMHAICTCYDVTSHDIL